jgi:hypothetical protein
MRNVGKAMMSVAAVLVILTTTVNASLINVGDASNVALAATVVASNSNPIGGSNLAAVTNNGVDDATTGAAFDWNQCFLFGNRADPDPLYTLDLTWATAHNIESLETYVNSAASGAGCSTSFVEFFVKQGTGPLASVGLVNVPQTAPDIGYYTLTKLNGSWSNVTEVQYRFTADGNYFGPRVAEVLAIAATSSTPEPSALMLMASGLFGILAYAWRKRK